MPSRSPTRPASQVLRARSFAPIEPKQARILILGSMPGQMSLQRQQYYAHPHNAFWKIMGALLGFAPELGYAARIAVLQAHGIALWDALQSCQRPGSADADIELASARPNAIPALLRRHPGIERIGFNGATAQRCFQRALDARPAWAAALQQRPTPLALVRLPSSSAAHATLGLAQKTEAWGQALGLPQLRPRSATGGAPGGAPTGASTTSNPRS